MQFAWIQSHCFKIFHFSTRNRRKDMQVFGLPFKNAWSTIENIYIVMSTVSLQNINNSNFCFFNDITVMLLEVFVFVGKNILQVWLGFVPLLSALDTDTRRQYTVAVTNAIAFKIIILPTHLQKI